MDNKHTYVMERILLIAHFWTLEHQHFYSTQHMDGLNGTEYNGNKLSINVSKPKEKPKEKKKDKKKKMKAADIAERFSSESSRVFVKNIEKDADVDEVRKLFETHGTVKDVYNPGKGFAFVR